MEDIMKDVVYILNDLSDYFRVDYKGIKYTFMEGKPVKIDYSNDPRLVSYLLQFVQLRLATAKEAGIEDENKKEQTNEKVNKFSYRPKSN